MEPLKVLIQLSPTYQNKEGLEDFSSYNFFFEGCFRSVVEERRRSWFNDLAYNFLKITILQWCRVRWIDCKLR